MATQPFIWGRGGRRLTQDEIAREREIAAALSRRGDPAFDNAGWLGALGRGLEGIQLGLDNRRLDAAADQNATENKSLLEALLSGSSSAAPPAPAPSVSNAPAVSYPNAPVVAEGEIADYIRSSAAARGIDPDVALRVAISEGGLKDPIRQSDVVKNGVREESYGPFQLYFGGGLGNKALDAGIDARDPNQWKQGIDFALDQAATGGWGPWYGAARVGIGNRDGLGNARAIGYSAKSSPAPVVAADQVSAPSGYVDPMVSAPNYNPDVANALVSAPPSPAPVASTVAPVVQNVAPTNSLGVSPAVLQALTSPYANESTKGVANLLLQQQQGATEEARKQALAEQQRQQEIVRRQSIAAQAGIDPVYATDDDIWKAAAGNIFADPSVTNVNGVVYDNRTRQPLFGAPEKPTSVQEFEYGQQNPDYFDQQERLRRSGANTTEGAIPTGYQAVRDENQRVLRYDPIPGGPADTTKKTELTKSNTERSGTIVLEDVDRAVNAIENNPALTTGIIGNWSRGISGTPANKVQNLLQTIRANSAFDRLQQMREASPTGGALGAVSDSELGLLQNAIGSLEQSNDSEDLTYNLRRVQGIYEDIIYGKDEAKRLREERRKATSENPLPPQQRGKKTSTGATWEILD